jgi:hypothetical protein
MTFDTDFRAPTNTERELLRRLMQADFPGRDELAVIVEQVEVKTIDDIGGLELRSTAPGRASIVKRVPVEAEARDEDGYNIHLQLHVLDGRPVELEIYKDDGSPVRRMPSPSDFELIVLPPMPGERKAT